MIFFMESLISNFSKKRFLKPSALSSQILINWVNLKMASPKFQHNHQGKDSFERSGGGIFISLSYNQRVEK